jgi:hypothetical protein
MPDVRDLGIEAMARAQGNVDAHAKHDSSRELASILVSLDLGSCGDIIALTRLVQDAKANS